MSRPSLILCAVFCFIACSNTFPEEGSDLAVRELKGPIKYVEAKHYVAKRRAKPFDLDNLRLEDDFRDASTRLWSFNEDGNITKNSYFRGDELKWEIVDSFDLRGNLIQSINYDYYRGKILDNTRLFTYDENNNLLEALMFNIDSLLITKKEISYNQQNQKLKEEDISGKSQKITQQSTFKYDDNGRLIEKLTTHLLNKVNPPIKVIYTYDGNSPYKSSKSVYKVDSTQTLTREEKYIYYSGNQQQERNVIYAKTNSKRKVLFNKQGWVEDIKDWELAGEGKMLKHIKYVYKFDKKDNWTQRATFENEELKTVELRSIEYY